MLFSQCSLWSSISLTASPLISVLPQIDPILGSLPRQADCTACSQYSNSPAHPFSPASIFNSIAFSTTFREESALHSRSFYHYTALMFIMHKLLLIVPIQYCYETQDLWLPEEKWKTRNVDNLLITWDYISLNWTCRETKARKKKLIVFPFWTTCPSNCFPDR